MNTKVALLAITLLLVVGTVAAAQDGAPLGRGSTTGDPAASSATSSSSPTSGMSTRSNPSGSGTSTSGGRDDNGDQGRDKMPGSNMSVKPLDPSKAR